MFLKVNFELFDIELFISKEIIFQNFNFFEKNVSCKFYAFPEKTFGKTNSYR